MRPDHERPPLYTVWEEFCGWTFDRTATIPKSQRFTFGQRLDEHALDILELIVYAIYSQDKVELLQQINLRLEVLRTLWRLLQKRGWITLKQLHFANSKMDEAGRMVGGWMKQQHGKDV
jgi:hypothetical protein